MSGKSGVTARIDRRAARTRGALHDSLMSLTGTKDYRAITIDEICAAADVGRSTFYGHYANKDELRRSGLAQMRREIASRLRASMAEEAASGPARSFAFVRPLLEHAQAHSQRFGAMAEADRGLALDVLIDLFAEFARAELAGTAGTAPSAPEEREVTLRFLAGAFDALLRWWLDRDNRPPAPQLADMFERLAAGAARSSPL